jgi:hypothetical protein
MNVGSSVFESSGVGVENETDVSSDNEFGCRHAISKPARKIGNNIEMFLIVRIPRSNL